MIQTLGPPPIRTPMEVIAGAVTIRLDSPMGKWLHRIFTILAGVGPQIRGEALLNFPNTTAQTSSDLTVSAMGAMPGQVVTLGAPPAPANSCFMAFVSAADVVTVRFCNFSSGALNPGADTFTVIVVT